MSARARTRWASPSQKAPNHVRKSSRSSSLRKIQIPSFLRPITSCKAQGAFTLTCLGMPPTRYLSISPVKHYFSLPQRPHLAPLWTLAKGLPRWAWVLIGLAILYFFNVASGSIYSQTMWNMLHDQIAQEDKAVQEELEKEVTHFMENRTPAQRASGSERRCGY